MPDEFLARHTSPFLVGCYLATNAIPDAYLIVDSPDCAFFKAELVAGSHDLCSTLLDCRGAHRILHTRNDIGAIIGDRRQAVADVIRQVSADSLSSVVAISAMPMATVTGVDYEQLLRQVEREYPKVMLNIPSGSMSLDWLDGYARVMTELAYRLPLPETSKRSDAVAIVGHMMERTEGDNIANVDEMRRLLAELGLETTAVWLSGSSAKDLARVAEAGTILSMPYGREAATVLSERTSARVVELGIPFGLAATIDWVDAVAAALGKQAAAETLKRRELPVIARRLEWVLPRRLLGRRWFVVAEPYTARALAGIADDLGAKIVAAAISAAPYHLPAEGILGADGDRPVLFEPATNKLVELVLQHFSGPDPADLLFADGRIVDQVGSLGIPFYEIGYPSFFRHSLGDTPSFGFRGLLCFVSEIANRITLAEVMDWRLDRFRPQRRDAASPPSAAA